MTNAGRLGRVFGRRYEKAKAVAAFALLGGVFLLGASPAHAADFTVTTTNDGGPGSLRQAILDANAQPGADTIGFGIPVTPIPGWPVPAQTITPTSALPPVTGPVTIDGYTQPGAVPNTLAVGNNAQPKIVLDGHNVPAYARGLQILAPNSTVRGLVIHRFAAGPASLGTGIEVVSSNNTIEGNFVGTGTTGTVAFANGTGVRVLGSNNRIGGTDPADRNVISGNANTGLSLSGGQNGSGNVVEGNYIGTDAAGTRALPNRAKGLGIFGLNDNTIGGTTDAARNVISGNAQGGIEIRDAVRNTIRRNYVGLGATREPLGNSPGGLTFPGVEIASVNGDTKENTVGGETAADGNVIAHNGGSGVRVFREGATSNPILSNSVHSNGLLGIDLAGGFENADGVTGNDDDDADNGPNGLLNIPEAVAATRDNAGVTTVTGRLDTAPDTTLRVQFFASPRKDTSGYGEGQTLLGEQTVSTDGLGLAALSFQTTSAPAGAFVSATATDTVTGNTSEFSIAAAVRAEDTAAPTVARTVPADGVTDIAPATNVSAFFSEGMRPGTVNANTVRLRQAGTTTSIPATVTYDAANKRAVLNPDANLRRGATYIATVTAGAKDEAGNALDQDSGTAGNQAKTWRFTVRR